MGCKSSTCTLGLPKPDVCELGEKPSQDRFRLFRSKYTRYVPKDNGRNNEVRVAPPESRLVHDTRVLVVSYIGAASRDAGALALSSWFWYEAVGDDEEFWSSWLSSRWGRVVMRRGGQERGRERDDGTPGDPSSSLGSEYSTASEGTTSTELSTPPLCVLRRRRDYGTTPRRGVVTSVSNLVNRAGRDTPGGLPFHLCCRHSDGDDDRLEKGLDLQCTVALYNAALNVKSFRRALFLSSHLCSKSGMKNREMVQRLIVRQALNPTDVIVVDEGSRLKPVTRDGSWKALGASLGLVGGVYRETLVYSKEEDAQVAAALPEWVPEPGLTSTKKSKKAGYTPPPPVPLKPSDETAEHLLFLTIADPLTSTLPRAHPRSLGSSPVVEPLYRIVPRETVLGPATIQTLASRGMMSPKTGAQSLKTTSRLPGVPLCIRPAGGDNRGLPNFDTAPNAPFGRYDFVGNCPANVRHRIGLKKWKLKNEFIPVLDFFMVNLGWNWTGDGRVPSLELNFPTPSGRLRSFRLKAFVTRTETVRVNTLVYDYITWVRSQDEQDLFEPLLPTIEAEKGLKEECGNVRNNTRALKPAGLREVLQSAGWLKTRKHYCGGVYEATTPLSTSEIGLLSDDNCARGTFLR